MEKGGIHPWIGYKWKGMLYKGVQIACPSFCTKRNTFRSKGFTMMATTQVETIGKTRNLDEIKWTFIGNTTATNRSKAIQTRLCIETVIETLPRKLIVLQKINPAIPVIRHCKERGGATDFANIKCWSSQPALASACSRARFLAFPDWLERQAMLANRLLCGCRQYRNVMLFRLQRIRKVWSQKSIIMYWMYFNHNFLLSYNFNDLLQVICIFKYSPAIRKLIFFSRINASLYTEIPVSWPRKENENWFAKFRVNKNYTARMMSLLCPYEIFHYNTCHHL